MKILLSKVSNTDTTILYGMHLLDHHKDKTDYLAGSIDQLHSTFTSVLKIYYHKTVKLWGEKGHLPVARAVCYV